METKIAELPELDTLTEKLTAEEKSALSAQMYALEELLQKLAEALGGNTDDALAVLSQEAQEHYQAIYEAWKSLEAASVTETPNGFAVLAVEDDAEKLAQIEARLKEGELFDFGAATIAGLQSFKDELDSISESLNALVFAEDSAEYTRAQKAKELVYNLNIQLLENLEKRVTEIEEAGFDGLDDDEKAELRTKLNDLSELAWKLYNTFLSEETAELRKRAQDLNQRVADLLYILSGGTNILASAPFFKPETIAFYDTDDKLVWQWNDQNIQQVGAVRPTGSIFGTPVWSEGNGPDFQNAYVEVVRTLRGPRRQMAMICRCGISSTKACGFTWEYLYDHRATFFNLYQITFQLDTQGGTVNVALRADTMIREFTGKIGETYEVTYKLRVREDKELAGYQLTQSDDGKTIMTTPTTSLSATVLWYDNHNNYEDTEKNNPRPDQAQYKEKLTLMRSYINSDQTEVIETVTEYDLVITENATVEGDPGDTWSISIKDLPKYSPSGEKYTYCLRQESEDGTLSAGVNTGAYYKPVVDNGSLLDPDHADCIYDGGTITNTLARDGKLEFHKEWNDGANNPEDRPKTTLYFYRVTESDVVQNGTLVGFEGSPVVGYDKIGNIEKLPGEEVIITLPEDDSTLPMFDNYGRRYIYYAVERMENAGDYVAEIDNTSADLALIPAKEQKLIRDAANKQGYILNGAMITNKLEREVTVPVTVEFHAQAIQNDMDATSVKLQLQYFDSGTQSWQSYATTDYDGELILDAFRAEVMTLTGKSEPVPKYDGSGYEIQYRWVQTDMSVRGGTPETPLETETVDDPQTVTLKKDGAEVGPGVEKDYTTEQFKVAYDFGGDTGEYPSGTTITNTLVGNTQVVAEKIWSYTVEDQNGETTTYTYPGNWNGEAIEGLAAPESGWPIDMELVYQVYRNVCFWTRDW